MTNIHFPVDGQGTQSLQKQNKVNKSSFHVDSVMPESENKNKQPKQKPAASENDKHNNAETSAPDKNTAVTQTPSRKEVSRSEDRRQNDRRHKNQPVLLNTRSEHDRRKTPGQREDDAIHPNLQFGIDTKA
ncbi:MAG: hypothetical protein OEY11_08790 [Gammaproteobacteria bacterium]|nr:hypothetical protein [Gammaproteobacteria bacterium]